MLVNLTSVLTSEGKTEQLQLNPELEECIHLSNPYRIVHKEPLKLTLSNTGVGKAHIAGETSLVVMLHCDRCLTDVEYTFDLSFSREVISPDHDKITDTEDTDSIEEESNFMEGYELNVENLVSNELLINWPMKVLCREDCRGICIQCGKDLNTGTCDCDTFVPDPRMAAIQDIFNANNKEV
ncbi:MAG: DUF177 domain-containing protein [Lachnospiraceae bacterium]